MITVIADDLTGAAEVAGVCLRYGIDVAFGIDAVPVKQATITVIATDSRSLNAQEAFKIHADLYQQILKKDNETILFKKCDSVLRGHVLTELSAMFEATKKNTILLQPAHPKNKRYIRNGMYYIEDQLIEDSNFASDPEFPVSNSSVKHMLLSRGSSNIKVGVGTVEQIVEDGCYVPDCCSEIDLNHTLNLYKSNMLLGGSAAFFEQCLIKLQLAETVVKVLPLKCSKNYVLVSGSAHEKSIQYAEKLAAGNVKLLEFPEHLLIQESSVADLDEWAEGVSTIYNDKQKLILRISNRNIVFANSSKVLKNRLSYVVAHLCKNEPVEHLFIEGGATAYSVLKALKWQSFTPISELASGVVRMQVQTDKSKTVTIKPGSYDWPADLLN